MKDGLLPIIALAGAVSVALLWSMSASDPYWRLFDDTDAPTFGQSQEPDAELANTTLAIAPLDFGNADTGSMSPLNKVQDAPSSIADLSGAPPHSPIDAGDAAIPAPMIALTPPAEPRSLADQEIDLDIAYGPPRAAAPERVNLRSGAAADGVNSPELVVTFAPAPLPAPLVLRDRADGTVAAAVSGDELDPFVAPAAPAQPRIAASQKTETALDLKRRQRIDVQRRLALAGFNPRGIDGVFGPRTRAAITDFQTAWDFPATGYLEVSLIADLNQRTEEAYQAWKHQMAAARSAAPEVAPVASERQLANAEGKGKCLRDSNGRIVERQSLACDITGFGEKFISLGRTTLNDEEEATPEIISSTSQETLPSKLGN